MDPTLQPRERGPNHATQYVSQIRLHRYHTSRSADPVGILQYPGRHGRRHRHAPGTLLRLNSGLSGMVIASANLVFNQIQTERQSNATNDGSRPRWHHLHNDPSENKVPSPSRYRPSSCQLSLLILVCTNQVLQEPRKPL